MEKDINTKGIKDPQKINKTIFNTYNKMYNPKINIETKPKTHKISITRWITSFTKLFKKFINKATGPQTNILTWPMYMLTEDNVIWYKRKKWYKYLCLSLIIISCIAFLPYQLLPIIFILMFINVNGNTDVNYKFNNILKNIIIEEIKEGNLNINLPLSIMHKVMLVNILITDKKCVPDILQYLANNNITKEDLAYYYNVFEKPQIRLDLLYDFIIGLDANDKLNLVVQFDKFCNVNSC